MIHLYYISLQVLQKSEYFYFTAAPVPKDPSTIILSWHQYNTSLTVTRPRTWYPPIIASIVKDSALDAIAHAGYDDC